MDAVAVQVIEDQATDCAHGLVAEISVGAAARWHAHRHVVGGGRDVAGGVGFGHQVAACGDAQEVVASVAGCGGGIDQHIVCCPQQPVHAWREQLDRHAADGGFAWVLDSVAVEVIEHCTTHCAHGLISEVGGRRATATHTDGYQVWRGAGEATRIGFLDGVVAGHHAGEGVGAVASRRGAGHRVVRRPHNPVGACINQLDRHAVQPGLT